MNDIETSNLQTVLQVTPDVQVEGDLKGAAEKKRSTKRVKLQSNPPS